MSRFIKKLFFLLLGCFLLLETFSRIFIDPLYFYSINTYNEKGEKSIRQIYHNQETEHVDLLFIGSSRVPATINTQKIKELSGGKVVVNAGRGYMTPGIHYQALKSKLEKYPDYLKDAIVVIEYSGCDIYPSSFNEDKLKVYEESGNTDKPMPHLLLPYLNNKSFLSFLRDSHNSFRVKSKMTFLYLFAIVRANQYINEKYNNFNKPLFESTQQLLVSEGGIKNGHNASATKKAKKYAQLDKNEIIESDVLTDATINNSSFAKLCEIISNNGGKIMVYDMPLHNLQKDIYNSKKAIENKKVFNNWLVNNNIPILYTPGFKYTDNDFPDTWHLAINRRDEFTSKLFRQIIFEQLQYIVRY